MKLFTALAAFVTVAAVLFPLYEGTLAIVMALCGGIVVATLIYLALNMKEKMHQQQDEMLKQQLIESNNHLQQAFQTYQNQLTAHAEEVSNVTNEKLLTLWKATQADIKTDTKAMYDQSTQILHEVQDQQSQQKRVAEQLSNQLSQTSQTIETSLLNWLTKQEQQSEATFANVQATHKQLLDQTATTNSELTAMWKQYQEEQLVVRKQEKESFEQVVKTIEAKEAAYQAFLDEQKATFTQTYEELKQALLNAAQLSHEQLLKVWEKSAADQLALRADEKQHIQALQTELKDMLTTNMQTLSDTITAAWNQTNEGLTALRTAEKAHAAEVLATFTNANDKLIETVAKQETTFTTAQSFYENTYTSIHSFVENVNKHEERLVAHHQQLINTQQTIRETIEATLQQTFTQHTDVLNNVQQKLNASLEELKEQRAVASGEFEEFIGLFAETLDAQTESSAALQKDLNDKISELVENLEDTMSKLAKDQQRSMNELALKINNTVEQIQEAMNKNNELYGVVVEQSKATQQTAASLQTAFKDNSTLNKKELELLEKLMR